MRDITPKERQQLQHAAQYVQVFERRPPKKEADTFRAGCFGCDHGAGRMAGDRRYTTIQIFPADSYNDPYDHDDDEFMSVVISPQDKFYADGDASAWYSMPKLMNRYVNLNAPAVVIVRDTDLLANPTLYVRLVVQNGELRHINSRIQITDLFDPTEWADSYTVLSSSTQYRGTYIDPQYTMNANDVIPFKAARFSGQGVYIRCRAYFDDSSVHGGPLNLQRITPNKTKKDSQMWKVKVPKLIEPLGQHLAQEVAQAYDYGAQIAPTYEQAQATMQEEIQNLHIAIGDTIAQNTHTHTIVGYTDTPNQGGHTIGDGNP